MKVKVWAYTWDTDNGIGTRIYPTEKDAVQAAGDGFIDEHDSKETFNSLLNEDKVEAAESFLRKYVEYSEDRFFISQCDIELTLRDDRIVKLEESDYEYLGLRENSAYN